MHVSYHVQWQVWKVMWPVKLAFLLAGLVIVSCAEVFHSVIHAA